MQNSAAAGARKRVVIWVSQAGAAGLTLGGRSSTNAWEAGDVVRRVRR